MTDLDNHCVKPSAALIQAARFVACGLPPLEERLEQIEGYPTALGIRTGCLPGFGSPNERKDAVRKLLKLLATGNIVATGQPMKLAAQQKIGVVNEGGSVTPLIFDRDYGLPNISRFTKLSDPPKTTPIPPEFWDIDRIDWRNCFIWDRVLEEGPESLPDDAIVAYGNITIEMADLHDACDWELLPDATEVIEATRPSYRSPFVDLILKAEAHFGERLLDRRMDITVIYDWLNAEGPKIEDANWSENKTKMMTTFLRMPRFQIGGNKPSK
jgi:hypothetical protein